MMDFVINTARMKLWDMHLCVNHPIYAHDVRSNMPRDEV